MLTGDNIALQFSHALSPLDNGTFSIDYLPTVKYPAGGWFKLRLIQDAGNYYELVNSDGYGSFGIEKIVGGVVVDSASFVSEYSQGSTYPIAVSFSPGQTTVDAFGEILVMNTDINSIMVSSFEFDLGQQDAYVDNILYLDNSVAAVTITENSGSTDVDETGPTQDTYTVVLDTQPTGDVVVTVTSTDTTTGVTVDVASLSLTFNNTTWSTPQPVTVTAVDDSVVEGAHSVAIDHDIDTVLTQDANYDALAGTLGSVTANITDND